MDIIIVGGGCYGTFYVRQLLRCARFVGFDKIHVVDHDPDCRAKREYGAPGGDPEGRLVFHVREARAFLDDYFTRCLKKRRGGERVDDLYVPPTFAPHLLLELFLRTARLEFPSLVFDRKKAEEPMGTPVDLPLEEGTRALSFATWNCPPTCIEPPVCPHTRTARDWDMKRYLGGKGVDARIFQCRHYKMGVGGIPVDAILDEYERFRREAQTPGSGPIAVATVSSCHGLIGFVEVRNA